MTCDAYRVLEWADALLGRTCYLECVRHSAPRRRLRRGAAVVLEPNKEDRCDHDDVCAKGFYGNFGAKRTDKGTDGLFTTMAV